MKYEVTIDVISTYKMIVEADNEDQAIEIANKANTDQATLYNIYQWDAVEAQEIKRG